jgi:hypothetical protein
MTGVLKPLAGVTLLVGSNPTPSALTSESALWPTEMLGHASPA